VAITALGHGDIKEGPEAGDINLDLGTLSRCTEELNCVLECFLVGMFVPRVPAVGILRMSIKDMDDHAVVGLTMDESRYSTFLASICHTTSSIFLILRPSPSASL